MVRGAVREGMVVERMRMVGEDLNLLDLTLNCCTEDASFVNRFRGTHDQVKALWRDCGSLVLYIILVG